MVDGQGLDDGVLGHVRVLVLVDQDVAEAGVQLGADVAVLLQDLDDVDEEVVEVHGGGGLQPLLVGGVDLGDEAVLVVAGAVGEGLGGGQVVLGPADGPLDLLGGDRRLLDAHCVEDVADGPQAVGLVVDGVRGVQADERAVRPEQAGAEAVEGADPDPGAGDDGLDALAHLAGRLVGERQGQDVLRGDALPQQVGDPAGDDAGLPRAGAGQDEERAVHVLDGFALGGRQVGQEVHRGPCSGRIARVPVPGVGPQKYSGGGPGGRSDFGPDGRGGRRDRRHPTRPTGACVKLGRWFPMGRGGGAGWRSSGSDRGSWSARGSVP